MVLDRLGGDEQRPCDLPVGAALSRQASDAQLTGRKRVEHVSMKTYLINHLGRAESDDPHMWTLLEVVQNAASASLASHLTGFTTS